MDDQPGSPARPSRTCRKPSHVLRTTPSHPALALLLGAAMLLALCTISLAQHVSEIHLKYDDGSEQHITVAQATPPPATAPSGAPATTQPSTLTPFRSSISQAGLATFFDAVGCAPANADPTSFTWTWDFGDPASARNQMKGFNAAHIYEEPGTYTVTLTITSQANKVGENTSSPPHPLTWTSSITIPRSTRRIFNVPPGSDLSFYRGQSNIELVLSKGTYSARQTVTFNNNVLLRGNGAVLDLVAPVDGFVLGTNCRITGLTIDYPAAAHPASSNFNGVATAFYPAKGNIAIDHCTFLNVAYCVNGNRRPDGVLIQDCSAPLIDGLRGYLAWVQGKQWVITGNTVKNPIIEHCIRCEDNSGPLSITDNTLSNLSSAQSGVKDDWSKGCILLHWTHDVYIAGNSITGQSANGGGDVGVGPLRYNGQPGNPERVLRTIVEDNTFHSANLGVDAGAIDTVLRDNTFLADQPWPVTNAIIVNAADSQRDRDVQNLRIRDNTAHTPYVPLRIKQGQVKDLISNWTPQ